MTHILAGNVQLYRVYGDFYGLCNEDNLEMCGYSLVVLYPQQTYLLILSHQHISNGSEFPSTEVGILDSLISGGQNQGLQTHVTLSKA